MADLNWIDVADTAVKMLGGASVAGVFTYFVSRSRHDHEMKKAKYEQELSILKEINMCIDECTNNLNDYSHASRSILLPQEGQKAKENSEMLMLGFKSIIRAKGSSYLIGQIELGASFDSVGESLLEVYYLASDEIPDINNNDIHRVLSMASEKLKALNTDMQGLRKKVSDAYSTISPV